MDPEQDLQQHVPVGSSQPFLKKSAIILVLVIVILGVSAASGYYFFHNGTVDEEMQSEDIENERSAETEAALQVWSTRNTESTVVNLDDYIAELDEQINDPTVSQTDRRGLLIRKAIALGTIRTLGIPRDSVKESASILRSLYNAEPTNESEEIYKNATIAAYINLLYSTCYDTTLGAELPEKYQNSHASFILNNHSPRASLILAYRDLAYSELDPKYYNDAYTVMNRAFISAMYLYAFGSKENSGDEVGDEEHARIVKQLSEDVLNYPYLERILYKGVNKSVIDPTLRYAFAYDIANTYGKGNVDDETNANIDYNYEYVYSTLAEMRPDDLTGNAMVNVLNTISYLESMHRRYAKSELNEERVNSLIELFIENVSLNKETKELFSGYFLEGMTEDGAWMPVRANFIKLAAEYPYLKTFFSESFGIEL